MPWVGGGARELGLGARGEELGYAKVALRGGGEEVVDAILCEYEVEKWVSKEGRGGSCGRNACETKPKEVNRGLVAGLSASLKPRPLLKLVSVGSAAGAPFRHRGEVEGAADLVTTDPVPPLSQEGVQTDPLPRRSPPSPSPFEAHRCPT